MFNEANNIKETVERIVNLASEISDDYEVIVVDDASTDKSGDMADSLAGADSHHIRSVRLKKNTRFGGALKAGLAAASKDIVIYTDSDLPAKEDDIKKALELLDRTASDIVTAYSLVVKDSSLKRIAMSKVYNFLVNILFRLKIRDINSGLKIYRREVLKGLNLISKSPFIDVEIFAEASRKNCKISQYGLIFDLRMKGTSTISRSSVVARTFFDMLRYKFFRK